MTEVYGDILFLINAGMDACCFFLTGRMLHRRLSGIRLLLGSLIGGVYAVLALFPDFGRFPALLLDLSVCVGMCAVVFGGGSGRISGRIRRLFTTSAVYIVMSMLLGGIMTAFAFLLNRAGFPSLMPAGQDGLSSWLFVLLALAGSAVTLWGGRLFRKQKAKQPCLVTIVMNGQTVTLEGIVDTGNLLRDPMDGRPVVAVDAGAIRPLLSDGMYEAVCRGCLRFDREGRLSSVCRESVPSHSPEDSSAMRRMRIIPADTATGHTLLVGLIPDRMTIRLSGSSGETEADVDALFAPMVQADRNGHAPVQALIPAELADFPTGFRKAGAKKGRQSEESVASRPSVSESSPVSGSCPDQENALRKRRIPKS